MKAIDRPGVIDALRAIRAEAHRLELEPVYQHASVRSLALKLGYPELLPDILDACVENGFNYCLDHTVPCEGELPSWQVCHWGADQLRSRLDSVDYRVYSTQYTG